MTDREKEAREWASTNYDALRSPRLQIEEAYRAALASRDAEVEALKAKVKAALLVIQKPDWGKFCTERLTDIFNILKD